MRKIVIAGNWKMHKTQAEALVFLQGFMGQLSETPEDREILLCVPYTALSLLSKNLHGGAGQSRCPKRPLGNIRGLYWRDRCANAVGIGDTLCGDWSQ